MFAALVFVARQLGAVSFGAFAYAQALTQYAVLLVEFGYPSGGTQRIATLRDDPQALSRTFSVIVASQALLALLAMGVVVVAWALGVALSGPWRATTALVFAGSSAILGAALQPSWLLLGLERLRELAWIQLAGKLVSLTLIVLWVRGPDDLAWAIFMLGTSPLVAGMAIIGLCARERLVRWHRPSLSAIARELRQAWVVFAPGAVSGAYTTLPAVVLGMVAPQASVAYYALADRLKGVVTLALQPFSTTLIARMSVLFGRADGSASRMLKRSVLFNMVAGGLCSGVLFFAADPLVMLVGGADYANAAPVLRWLAFVPLVVSLSNVASLHVLLPKGRAGTIQRIVLFVSVTGLAWLWPFVRHGGEIAAAQFVLVSELLGCGLMWWFARRALSGRS